MANLNAPPSYCGGIIISIIKSDITNIKSSKITAIIIISNVQRHHQDHHLYINVITIVIMYVNVIELNSRVHSRHLRDFVFYFFRLDGNSDASWDIFPAFFFS